jgi:serine/threonine protein kinase
MRTGSFCIGEAEYVLGAKLGQGSYGTVYLAVSKGDDEKRAVKLLRTTEVGLAPTSLREISILGRIRHPNIVRFLGIVAVQGGKQVGLVMPHAPHTLRSLLRTQWGALPMRPSLARSLARQLLTGLSHLHAAGIWHRDIKPSNLLVGRAGGLRIADFGLAAVRRVCSDLTSRVVTLCYRPPELLLRINPYDGAKVDIWSAGCVLADMLRKGQSPPLFWGKTTQGVLKAIIRVIPGRLRLRGPKDLAAAVTSLLQLEPGRRPSAKRALRLL